MTVTTHSPNEILQNLGKFLDGDCDVVSFIKDMYVTNTYNALYLDIRHACSNSGCNLTIVNFYTFSLKAHFHKTQRA